MNHRCLGFATAAFLVYSSACSAATNASYIVGPNIGGNFAIDSTTPISAHFAPSDSANTGTADVTSLATYGALKAGSALTTSGVGTLQIQNNDLTSDILTFQNSAFNGQTGYVTARIYYNWSITASATGSLGAANGNVATTLAIGPDSISATERKNVACSFSGICQSSSVPLLVTGSVIDFTPYGYIDGRFRFTFGQQAQLSFSLLANVNAQSQAGGSSMAIVDAAHSIYFGGIQGVTDSLGNPITYSLISDSGTDYTQSFAPDAPIPEPSTALLICFGLTGLVLSRRMPVAASCAPAPSLQPFRLQPKRPITLVPSKT